MKRSALQWYQTILLCVALFVLGAELRAWWDCHATGGTLMRTFLWFRCEP